MVPPDDTEDTPDREVASAAASPLVDLDLWLLFAVTLVGVGNVSSVSPAFPQVVEVFGISRAEVGWVVTAYSLPGVLSAPLAGIGADRLGRKRVLVPTLFVFGIAGGACALARSFPVLLGLRAAQGLAAAPLVGLAITIIGDRYEGTTRATAVGYNATALNVGTAAYPAIGGVLAAIAWYVPFALPLLALPVGAAVVWRLEAPAVDRQGEAERFGGYLRKVVGRLRDRRVDDCETAVYLGFWSSTSAFSYSSSGLFSRTFPSCSRPNLAPLPSRQGPCWPWRRYPAPS